MNKLDTHIHYEDGMRPRAVLIHGRSSDFPVVKSQLEDVEGVLSAVDLSLLCAGHNHVLKQFVYSLDRKNLLLLRSPSI